MNTFPAAAPPIENRSKFCYILSMGGAAAGADMGTLRLGLLLLDRYQMLSILMVAIICKTRLRLRYLENTLSSVISYQS